MRGVSDYGPGNTSCSFLVCSSWGVGVTHLSGQSYTRAMPFTVTPGMSFSVNAITVTAYQSNGPASGQLILSINADSGGLPGAALEQFTFSNLPNLNATSYLSNPYPLLATSVLHPTLVGNSQYWLTATVNDPSNVTVNWVENNQGVTGFVALQTGNTALGLVRPFATFSDIQCNWDSKVIAPKIVSRRQSRSIRASREWLEGGASGCIQVGRSGGTPSNASEIRSRRADRRTATCWPGGGPCPSQSIRPMCNTCTVIDPDSPGQPDSPY